MPIGTRSDPTSHTNHGVPYIRCHWVPRMSSRVIPKTPVMNLRHPAINRELYSPPTTAPWPWSRCATLSPKPCLFSDSAPPLLGDNPCWVAGIYVRFHSIKACAFEPQNDPSSMRLGFHSVHCRLSLAQWRMRFYIDC